MEHFFNDFYSIVLDNALTEILTGKAALAEGNALVEKGDLLCVAAGFGCTLDEAVSQHIGVAALTEAGGYDKDFFTHDSFSLKVFFYYNTRTA